MGRKLSLVVVGVLLIGLAGGAIYCLSDPTPPQAPETSRSTLVQPPPSRTPLRTAPDATKPLASTPAAPVATRTLASATPPTASLPASAPLPTSPQASLAIAPRAAPTADGITGRVFGPDGKGLAKARVTLNGLNEQVLKQIPEGMRAMWLAQMETQLGGLNQSYMLESKETVVTDAEGRFHLAAIAEPKDPHWLLISHKTHVNVISKAFTKKITTPVEVTLVQGATLKVTLAAPGGAAVKAAQISIAPEKPESLAKISSRSLEFSYDLSFEAPEVVLARQAQQRAVREAHAARAAAAKGETKTASGSGAAQAEPSEELAAVDLTSGDEALLAETLVVEGGEIVEGGEAGEVLVLDPFPALAGASDAGVRVFTGVPPGSLKVNGSAEGYRTTTETLLLSSGESREVTITLQLGLALTGYVRTRQGKPIADAQVSGHRTSGMGQRQLQATSDAQGAFTLRGLEDATYQVSAYAEGYEHNYEQASSVRPGGAPLVLILNSTYHLRGRVLGAKGQPAAAGLQVSAVRSGQRFGGVSTAQTSAEGSFDLAGLSSGPYVVTVSGGEMTTLDPVSVTIKAADVDGVEVRVAIGASAEVVVTERGIPLAGVSLSVASSAELSNNPYGGMNQRSGAHETDDKGLVQLSGLAPGEYEVRATKEGFAPAKAVLVVDSDQAPRTLRIALVGGAILQCRVLEADGAPFASKMVMIIPKDAGLNSPAAFENSVSTSAEGRFEKKGLAGGDYMLQALEMTQQGGSGLRSLGEVHLEPSQTTSVELRLAEAGASIKGLVIKAGKPLPSTQVMVYKEGNLLGGFAQTTTDPQGRFEAKNLTPGTYVVSANGAAKATVTLEDNAQVEVRLEIKAGVIAGSLLGPDGRPAVAAGVRLQRLGDPSIEDNFKPETQTDDLGTFRVEDVRPGRYRLMSQVSGVGATAGIEFTLAEGEARTDLALKLGQGGSLALEITRADGKPAAGAQVTIYHLGLEVFSNQVGGWNSITTPVADRHGKASLTHLIPGTYAVFVGSTSHQLAVLGSIEIPEGGSQTQRLELAPGGSLEIQGPPGSVVEISLAGSKAPLGGTGNPWAQLFGLAKTGPEGRLTVPHLPAVQVEVQAKTPEGQTLTWRGLIRSGDTAIATLR